MINKENIAETYGAIVDAYSYNIMPDYGFHPWKYTAGSPFKLLAEMKKRDENMKKFLLGE